MLKHFVFFGLLCCLFLSSCYAPDSWSGFDSETWKADRYGCKGDRKEIIEEFEKIRRDMYGKREIVIRNTLGKPDQEELMAGNQRIYFYYLEKGEQCTDYRVRSEANWVEVRITAVGKISEVSYRYPTVKVKPE